MPEARDSYFHRGGAIPLTGRTIPAHFAEIVPWALQPFKQQRLAEAAGVACHH